MNLGDLYRLATMSNMEIKDDGGIEGDGASAFLFIQNLENYRREQGEMNRSFGKMFDEDDML
jgi:hypothetical protein